MRPLDKTSMGGPGSVFQTTRWSQIRNAKTDDETRRRIIINDLVAVYWKPVYCYLRCKGFDNERAKDLVQGFFEEVVLGRELIRRADQAKGRFRTWLLTSLERYVAEVHRRNTRKKRQPEGGLRHLEPEELAGLVHTQAEFAPEHAFYHAWAADVIDQVLAQVKEEYCGTGRPKHWQAFCAKVLDPITENVEALSHAEICKKYGIADESTASNMIITVKRRFRAVLTRNLSKYVRSDLEVEEEFREIRKALSMSSAG